MSALEAVFPKLWNWAAAFLGKVAVGGLLLGLVICLVELAVYHWKKKHEK